MFRHLQVILSQLMAHQQAQALWLERSLIRQAHIPTLQTEYSQVNI